MSGITLYTSGSTDEPKKIFHSWDKLKFYATQSAKTIGLNEKDTVLDIFPGNTIAHYTITAYPAMLSGARLHTMIFNPYNYLETIESIRPSVIALIPKHYELLQQTKKWKNVNLSCVRYMITGSNKVSQCMINEFRERGVETVANWYGMTEMPPPVLIGHNSESFDPNPCSNYNVNFTEEGECVINGWHSGDVFELGSQIKFLRRIKDSNGSTWKTRV